MASVVDTFRESPSEELLLSCTKEQLLQIAESYEIEIAPRYKTLKETLRNVLKGYLVELGVLEMPAETVSLVEEVADPSVSEHAIRLRELALKEKEIELENAKLELRKREIDHQYELKRMELEMSGKSVVSNEFDVGRNRSMVPPFCEKDVEKYFCHFERVAASLKWPENVWSLLLQCVLTGKAQEAYASLSIEETADYKLVKAAILRAYELVPEAYRQRFRHYAKLSNQSYVEFAREKEMLFDRWCTSQKAESKEQVRQLILLEEFKNCVPSALSTYLNEQKADTLHKAATLADDFVLTHKITFKEKPREKVFAEAPVSLPRKSLRIRSTVPTDERACFYCKNSSHLIASCPVLRKKGKAKHVGLISVDSSSNFNCTSESDFNPTKDGYAPFLHYGTVSISSMSKPVPVRILRDTGASLSIILKGVLPLSEETATGSAVLVRGFEMGVADVPLHKISLQSELVSGDVIVGVRASLPIAGVTFILGNDLAGGSVWSDINVSPEVVPVPLAGTDDCALKYPDVFAACVLTRSMIKSAETSDSVDLCDTFMVNSDTTDLFSVPLQEKADLFPVSAEKDAIDCADLSLCPEKLIDAQKSDSTLTSLFELVRPEQENTCAPQMYFLRNGILMRKWVSPKSSEDWNVVNQIVIPVDYRDMILDCAHNGSAGHLGILKTYNRILRNFYWPGLKRDVARFCKTCHVCQVVGKPNQTIKPAPLYPIPMVSEPFEHILIDCVGPLPRSKSGFKYLLTIMCATTRFPEAIPLRSVTTRAITKALVKFFTLFGLPKILQSDQGTNFTSRTFSQVLKRLGIKHNVSTAYHPESQGALERFHQTLKSMLRTYCFELEGDWEEGLPWLLFASREVIQESLGFSPAELVFGYNLRGPLAVLKERWLSDSKSTTVPEYFSQFRTRLYRVRELAKQNLEKSQEKMKTWFDKKARERSFSPGDKVLVLLPVSGGSLQARYSGPYEIKRKLSDRDYVIHTSDRRKSLRVCHVNMIKPYYERKSDTEKVKNVIQSPVQESLSVGVFTSEPVDEKDVEPSRCIIEGRLKNSEMLENLTSKLPHLSQTEKAEVIGLVRSFPMLFSDIPGLTSVIEHDIDVGFTQPIKQHPYRVNPLKRSLLQKEVEYMLENHIAESSTSPWSSPCLLVEKSDGTFRFCTDYRRVNAVTKSDCYPLPRIDDCVDRVGSATYVSKLDLLKGYWQVGLSERAREISAFVTPDAFLNYRVMAFGMKNAPSTFQRLVNTVLAGVPNCEAYLDDVVLYSSTWQEHMSLLRQVFNRLAEAKLTVNLAKCEFGKATIDYLGKVIGNGEVRPVAAKVTAICDFPSPKDRKQLRRFLGMVGYYRSFCKNFATVVSPLTDLLCPKIQFEWSDACQCAFLPMSSVGCTTLFEAIQSCGGCKRCWCGSCPSAKRC
ncbi:uncharacterized protein [Danio rerio]|uniref:Uncharacterized protein n=1 Tax=Danio rerio TaxID=7955 RepID=A0AC58JTI7_DANRE